jgi:MSHA biogenesis protein MshK
MAQFMIRFFAIVVVSLLLPQVGYAQSITDPTRPPQVASVAGQAEAVESGPNLQSILIGPHRRLAIINGETVALHGKWGDQTLISISETQVVLLKGKELQTLKLFPDVDKRPSQIKAGVNKTKRRHN